MIINQIVSGGSGGGWQIGDLLTSYATKDDKWLECDGSAIPSDYNELRDICLNNGLVSSSINSTNVGSGYANGTSFYIFKENGTYYFLTYSGWVGKTSDLYNGPYTFLSHAVASNITSKLVKLNGYYMYGASSSTVTWVCYSQNLETTFSFVAIRTNSDGYVRLDSAPVYLNGIYMIVSYGILVYSSSPSGTWSNGVTIGVSSYSAYQVGDLCYFNNNYVFFYQSGTYITWSRISTYNSGTPTRVSSSGYTFSYTGAVGSCIQTNNALYILGRYASPERLGIFRLNSSWEFSLVQNVTGSAYQSILLDYNDTWYFAYNSTLTSLSVAKFDVQTESLSIISMSFSAPQTFTDRSIFIENNNIYALSYYGNAYIYSLYSGPVTPNISSDYGTTYIRALE